MAETARTITQEVHTQTVRQNSQGICGLQQSRESSELLQIELRDKGEKSHAVQREQQKAGNDVTMMWKKVMSAAETHRTLLCERGQSDQGPPTISCRCASQL